MVELRTAADAVRDAQVVDQRMVGHRMEFAIEDVGRALLAVDAPPPRIRCLAHGRGQKGKAGIVQELYHFREFIGLGGGLEDHRRAVFLFNRAVWVSGYPRWREDCPSGCGEGRSRGSSADRCARAR